MSNVNIKRVVENIRENTTVYTPLVEVVVNAIQAIECAGTTSGRINIRVIRSNQIETVGGLSDVQSFEVEDNGIGFTDEHRKSFDTLYTDLKIKEGGKGFGRFICMRYFQDMHIVSVYRDKDGFKRREFSMGNDQEIVVNEINSPSLTKQSGTVVKLNILKKEKSIEKKLSTIARNLIEKILPYFITEGYTCPEIVVSEYDGTDHIVLNEFCNNELSAQLVEISVDNNTFSLEANGVEEVFQVRVFKLYSPKTQKSRISLVAHQREVTQAFLDKYIPEFNEEFYDKEASGKINHERNYVVIAYVFGPYLDRHVSLERGDFKFLKDNDLFFGLSKTLIEKESADIAKEALGPDIVGRQEKKKTRVQSYVEETAPWHKSILNQMDLTDMPYKPSDEEIEARFQKVKYAQEVRIRKKVSQLLADGKIEDLKNKAQQIVSDITENSKNDLIHYVAQRKIILDLFDKSLQSDATGLYSSEGTVHDIIFPRRSNVETTTFEDHNLWILDERLNFTHFVSSDEPLNGGKTDRPDLIVFDKRVLFRGDNETSNPITIFEFKKPQRDDFANPSSQEDPVQQIVRYVNSIRAGRYKTHEGRKIMVADNTPFYGYVVCDLTPKVMDWLKDEKDFTPMPDQLGWFRWFGNIKLYIEVLSWDKLLRDAQMRNRIFFNKLGI